MIIERYQEHKHLEWIHDWLVEREISAHICENLPENGFIARIDKYPIAAGFVRSCEGSMGFLDGFITNPKADSKLRHEALDSIYEEIVKISKLFGISKLMCHSVDAGTLERAKRHGFNELPHTLMMKRID